MEKEKYNNGKKRVDEIKGFYIPEKLQYDEP